MREIIKRTIRYARRGTNVMTLVCSSECETLTLEQQKKIEIEMQFLLMSAGCNFVDRKNNRDILKEIQCSV